MWATSSQPARDPVGLDIVGCLIDTTPSIEVIVEGQTYPLRVHAEEDVQAR